MLVTMSFIAHCKVFRETLLRHILEADRANAAAGHGLLIGILTGPTVHHSTPYGWNIQEVYRLVKSQISTTRPLTMTIIRAHICR